jgi:predicted nucleotidyltransferase
MLDLEVALPKIKEYLSLQPEILLAYLYGSYAEERVFSWSDLDIGLLFVKGEPASQRFQQLFQHQAEISRLVNAVREPEIEVDIRDLSDGSPEYLMNVIRANQCLYARTKQDRVVFEEKVIKQYLSFKPILDLYYQETFKRVKNGQVSHRYAKHLTETRAAIGRT